MTLSYLLVAVGLLDAALIGGFSIALASALTD